MKGFTNLNRKGGSVKEAAPEKKTLSLSGHGTENKLKGIDTSAGSGFITLERRKKVGVAYPFHTISPAILEQLPTEPVVIQAPKENAAGPEINWWSVLATPVGMILVMGIMYFFVENISMTHYLMMLPISIIGVIGAVFTYRKQKKQIQNAGENNKTRYRAYLESVKSDLHEIVRRQQSVRNKDNPSAQQCAAMDEKSSDLWNRQTGTAEFMSVRIGSGNDSLCVEIRTPEKRYDRENELEEEARQIAESHKYVSDIPKLIDFKRHPSVGIVGNRQDVVNQTIALIVNATAKHSYEDLKVVVIYPREEAECWEELRWLPHLYDLKREQRYLACSQRPEARTLLNNLTQMVEKRTENTGIAAWNRAYQYPHYLIVIADPSCIRGPKIMESLMLNDPTLSVSTLILSEKIHELPSKCKAVLEMNRETGAFYETAAFNQRTEYIPDSITLSDLVKYCRTMAPIRITGAGSAAEIPSRYTFFDAWGIESPEELLLTEQWKKYIPYESMEVPLGAAEGGAVFCFDIHQHAYGVNGLYVGMAGSGKTSMVRSWILSMATKFSPRYVTFALIDFKGNSLLSGLDQLPHVVGTISNLDTDIRRNLIALESEIQRREKLLKKYGGSIYTSYEEGDRSLPFLFIVIDELNEFKTWARNTEVDGMVLLNRLSQVGRALGIHLIAGSQTSAPFTDIIEGNSNFYWCLKTTDTADSRHMLKTDDAYYITNKGRAFVRVGANEVYEEIQPVYADCAYLTPEVVAQLPEQQMALVSLQGFRSGMEQDLPVAQNTQLEAVVEHIRMVVAKQRIPNPPKVWPDRLPAALYLDELEQPDCGALCVAAGLVDDPKAQRQYPLHIDINKHIILYSTPKLERDAQDSVTDNAMFLQTSTLSLLSHCGPEQVEVYLLGKALQVFRDCPQVQKYAETFGAKPVIHAVLDEIHRRRAKGMLKEDLPVVLFIDGIGEVVRDYREEMKEIAQYGVSCQCFLYATAGSVNEVSAISHCFAGGYAFWFSTSRYDYESALACKPVGKIPERDIFGRGVLFDESVKEFQVAKPACSATALNAAVQRIRDTYGNFTRAVKVLKKQDADITIGIGCGSHTEVIQNFRDNSHLLILGDQSVEREAQLCAVAKQLSKQPDIAQLIGVDMPSDIFRQLSGMQVVRSGAELDELLGNMRSELQKRAEKLSQNPDTQFPAIIFVIRDWDTCLNNISDLSRARIAQNILFKGKQLGIWVIASCTYEAFARRFAEDNADVTKLLGTGPAIFLNYCGQNVGPDYQKKLQQAAADPGALYIVGRTVEPITVIKEV